MAYPRIVVTGVAGSGKTTVGIALAQRLGVEFADGDDLHPAENVAKMARGEPLTDADREPWLERIEQWLGARESGVLACSGLRRAFRDLLREGRDVVLVYLRVSPEVAQARCALRIDHFFPAELLDSQFAALEEPGPDEDVLVADATLPTAEVVEAIATDLRGR
jgi:gluconokinase